MAIENLKKHVIFSFFFFFWNKAFWLYIASQTGGCALNYSTVFFLIIKIYIFGKRNSENSTNFANPMGKKKLQFFYIKILKKNSLVIIIVGCPHSISY